MLKQEVHSSKAQCYGACLTACSTLHFARAAAVEQHIFDQMSELNTENSQPETLFLNDFYWENYKKCTVQS